MPDQSSPCATAWASWLRPGSAPVGQTATPGARISTHSQRSAASELHPEADVRFRKRAAAGIGPRRRVCAPTTASETLRSLPQKAHDETEGLGIKEDLPR